MSLSSVIILYFLIMAWVAIAWLFWNTALVQGRVHVKFDYKFSFRYFRIGFGLQNYYQDSIRQLFIHPFPWLMLKITVQRY